jgi:hypothetical protein
VRVQRILYRSQALSRFTTQEVAALLAKARKRNAGLGVTGLLLMRDVHFMQLLEGPPAHVQEVMDLIRADPRHHRIELLLDESGLEERLFSEWSMAFRDASAPSLRALAGFSTFLDPPFATPVQEPQGKHAFELLDRFRLGH